MKGGSGGTASLMVEAALRRGLRACRCEVPHEQRRVVITGGPGSGKTALLEIAQRALCDHVVVLPEAASLLFGGGFPRIPSVAASQAAQRAIFFVQRELENVAADDSRAALVLCDRGTLDGVAYWPGADRDFLEGLGTNMSAELDRYAAVIHLRTPAASDGYNHRNPIRTESDGQAHAIDERILEVWAKHPHRIVVPSSHDFLQKAREALHALDQLFPECCRSPS